MHEARAAEIPPQYDLDICEVGGISAVLKIDRSAEFPPQTRPINCYVRRKC